jgi:uncharacterized protein
MIYLNLVMKILSHLENYCRGMTMWRLAPKDDVFFTLFKESILMVREGAEVFLNLKNDYSHLESHLAKVNDIEDNAELNTQRIIHKMESTYIMPIAREDIYSLARRIRNIIGIIQATMDRLKLYKLGKPHEDIWQLVGVLKEAIEAIDKTFDCFFNMRQNYDEIVQTCKIVNFHEHQADEYYRLGLARLFEEEKDPIEVIKWKEIYQHLEKALDECKELADHLKEVVIKNA